MLYRCDAHNVNKENRSSLLAAGLLFCNIDDGCGAFWVTEHVEIIRDQELEKFFTDHHVRSNAFLTQDGHSYQVNVGPWEIDIDINKETDHYAIHVLLVFRLSNHRLHEFNINLPIEDRSVRKNFNMIGVIKATWCFIFENGSIFFSYDIQSVAGNWQHKIKLPYN